MSTQNPGTGAFKTIAFDDGSTIEGAGGIVTITPASGGARKFPTPTGAAGRKGTATLVAGVATVSTTAVATGDVILCSMCTPAGSAIGVPSAAAADITAATSFVIRSKKADGTTETNDISTINWSIP